MQTDKPLNFVRLANGTLLQLQTDGSYRPTKSLTDYAALAKLSEEQIDHMAMNDPDHPGLDDAFWADFDAKQSAKEAISIKLDGDILSFFKEQGRGYQTQINAVLRRYVETQK